MVRNRARSEGPIIENTNFYDRNGVIYFTIPSLVSQRSESMTDYVVPNYSQLIGQGAIINNPCSYDVQDTSKTGPGTAHGVQIGSEWNFFDVRGGCLSNALLGYYGGTWTVSGSEVSVDTDLLIQQAKSQAIANIDASPYAFMEDLFEVGETIRFLRNPLGALKNLSKAFRADRKRKQSEGLTRTEAIADVWLAYRFAVTPLLRSIEDAYSLITVPQRERPVRQSAHGIAFDSDKVSGSLAGSVLAGNISYERSVRIGASILYEVDNPLNDFRFRAGLRKKDLAKTLWAILPYSFMIDRVSNISNTIGGISNFLDPAVHIRAGSVSERNSLMKTWSITNWTTASYAVTIDPDVVSDEVFAYNRSLWSPTVLDSFVRPSVSGLVKDAKSVADLAALIVRNFS